MSWIEKHPFETFGSFNLSQLKIDEAWLKVTNLHKTKQLWLYQLSSDCHECPFKRVDDDFDLLPGSSFQLPVSTKFPSVYRFRESDQPQYVLESDKSSFYCETKTSFGEFGIYDLKAGESNNCLVETQLDPVNIYLPILIVVIFYFLLAILVFLWNKYNVPIKGWVLSKINPSSTAASETLITEEDVQIKPNSLPRLRSLDTFRGMSIILMIWVNDGGASYYFTEHATWDGLYIADLVFPWFLWIMGVCIPVSIKSQLKRKVPKGAILKAILIRSLKLMGIGLILASKSGGPVDFEKFRLPGVLQRFSICYFVTAATMLLCASEDFVENKKSTNRFISAIQDITFIWKGWIISIVILFIHTMLTFLLKVPGCPTGYLGPGGLHEGKSHPSHCIGGASGYIDKQILTINHIYKYPTALYTYESEAYDPEGLLGTFTSLFQVWLGVQAGLTLQVYQQPWSRILRWSLWAILTGAIGAALCGAKQTGGLIPLNKNLWSLSYVMVTTCFALVLLIFLYVIIDLKKWWSGTPFFEPGMNSILLYVGHSVCYVMLPFHFTYKNGFNTHFLRLIESLWGVSLYVLIAIRLFNQKYFWTL